MSLFDEILKGDESIVKNENALGFEFIPKIMPFREQQQRYVANCIKPLLADKSGKNIFVYGPPGIGKTAAIKWVLRDLEEHTDDVFMIFVNCWNKNTTYKVMMEICEQLEYRFVQNKKTEELFGAIKKILNQKPVVLVFDEIDKAEDYDFLYSFIEEIHQKTIVLITNYKDWLTDLDHRIKSRLLPDMLEFKQYDKKETFGVMKQRKDYAFFPNVWEDKAFQLIVDKTAEIKDIRSGLFLMKESAGFAENEAAKKIDEEHAKKAILKLDEFKANDEENLEEDCQEILDIIKDNSGKSIGELHKVYEEQGKKMSYKSFSRRIEKIKNSKMITVEKIVGGKEGTKTIVNYGSIKKITDF